MTKQKLDDILINQDFMSKITNEYSHVNIHTNRALTQDLDRVILEHKEAQSRFCGDVKHPEDTKANQEHAEFLIGEALLYRSGDITNWLDTADNHSKFAFSTNFDEEDYGVVGTGIVCNRHNNTLKEYKTSHMNVVLRKDVFMPLGFSLVTAYPDMTSADIQPTNRDLTAFIKETKAYQQADDVGKTYLRYRTDVNNDYLATYKAGTSPDDSMMMLRVQTDNPNVYHEIKIKESGMSLRTVLNQYDDTGRIVKQTLDTNYTKIYAKHANVKNPHKADLQNNKVFNKFAKDYPEVATPLRNIKNYFGNKQQTFDFTKTQTKDRGKQADMKFNHIKQQPQSETPFEY